MDVPQDTCPRQSGSIRCCEGCPESCAKARKYCPGEIYRNLRNLRKDSRISPTTSVRLTVYWESQLNDSCRKKLRTLNNSVLVAAFDPLMTMPGLFDAGMMLSTLHTMIAMKSYEVSMSPDRADSLS
jgi:hypothetical protein